MVLSIFASWTTALQWLSFGQWHWLLDGEYLRCKIFTDGNSSTSRQNAIEIQKGEACQLIVYADSRSKDERLKMEATAWQAHYRLTSIQRCTPTHLAIWAKYMT